MRHTSRTFSCPSEGEEMTRDDPNERRIRPRQSARDFPTGFRQAPRRAGLWEPRGDPSKTCGKVAYLRWEHSP